MNQNTASQMMKNLQNTLNLKYTPDAFRSLALANSCANRPGMRTVVMMIEDGIFAVVCMADAARLEAAGYEWAN